MSRKPGDPVRKNVRLLRQMATGGMGSFWTAWHEALGIEVGVKFVDERYVEDPEALERFRREAAMAARIKSPHVVQVFDHGVMDDGAPYIIMELLEGESLAQRIDVGPLSLEDVARVIVQVARGLAVAHERGIVHRDIKPENIFLCDDEDGFMCKLLDFGVGRHLAPGERKLTAPGVLVGTPEYMSPEIILGRRQVDHHADLWSLAVVAYTALAGELPFDGDTARQIVMRVISSPHEPVSKFRRDIPPELDAWFSRALAKDVEQRFTSARELASAFVTAIDARRPSLRFSHPDAVETGTLPGFHERRSSRRAPVSDGGTVRIEEKLTPSGTAVMPRDAVETGTRTSAPVSSSVPAPESDPPPPPPAPRKLPLPVLLGGVSVVSALVTLLVIQLFTAPQPLRVASSSAVVPAPPSVDAAQPAVPTKTEPTPSSSVTPALSASVAPRPKDAHKPATEHTDYGF